MFSGDPACLAIAACSNLNAASTCVLWGSFKQALISRSEFTGLPPLRDKDVGGVPLIVGAQVDGIGPGNCRHIFAGIGDGPGDAEGFAWVERYGLSVFRVGDRDPGYLEVVAGAGREHDLEGFVRRDGAGVVGFAVPFEYIISVVRPDKEIPNAVDSRRNGDVGLGGIGFTGVQRGGVNRGAKQGVRAVQERVA